MEYLLAKAVSPDNSTQTVPREWTFRDIMHFPERERKEWLQACREEIEALKTRKVFVLANLPPGRKAIKTDGSSTSNLMVENEPASLPRVFSKLRALIMKQSSHQLSDSNQYTSCYRSLHLKTGISLPLMSSQLSCIGNSMRRSL